VSTYFTKSGLHYVNVNPGDYVKKGQIVGVVTDFHGEVVETILAPATGRVAFMVHDPVANSGETAITVCF
jgi:predicted deacylase